MRKEGIHAENQEIEFFALRDQYLAESDPKKKFKLASKIGYVMSDVPAGRKWVGQYLMQDGVEPPQANRLTFLLFPLQNQPTREEVDVVSKYWRPDRAHHLLATTAIILKGRKHLTPEEQQQYVDRAKQYYITVRKESDDPINDCTHLVKLVGEFEEERSLNWMLDIVENEKSVGPAPDLAVSYAMKFDPKRTAKALLTCIRKSPPLEEYTKKIWGVDKVLNIIDEVTKKEDFELIANVLLEANALDIKIDDFNPARSSQYLAKFVDLNHILKYKAEQVYSLLAKLPKNHKARKSLKKLLAEGI